MEANLQHDTDTVLTAYDYSGGSIGRRTSLGGLIAIAGQGTKLAIQVMGLAVLARLLRPDDFGLFAMAATVAGFVSLFADLGLSTATIQRKTLTQPLVSTLFFVGLGVAVAISAIAALLSGIAADFYGDARVGPLVIGLAMTVPIGAAGAQHGALLARGMRWMPIQLAAVSGQLAGLLGALVMIETGAGYWALVAQALVAQFCIAAIQWASCSWRPSLNLDFGGALRAIGFGANVTGFALANYLHRQADNVLIGKRWGEAELGFYTRAYSLVLLPMTLANSAIGMAVVPLLSRCQDDPQSWRRYFLRALSLNCFGAYCLAAILTVNAQAIVQFVLGPKWGYSGAILFWLSFSLFPIAPMNAMGWLFISLDKSSRWLRWGLLTSILFPLAFYAGLTFRSIGVAVAYSVTVTALAVPCVAYATEGTAAGIRDIGRAIRSPLIAASATLAGGLALRPLWAALSPPLSLAAGVFACIALFGTAGLLLLFIDREQQPQRRALIALLKARPNAFSIHR